jgi:hypothetical protein
MFGSFGDIGALVTRLAGADRGAVAQAASDHVAEMDTRELAGHVSTAAQSMDTGSLATLAQSLLGALAHNGSSESDAQDAGVPTDDARSGDPQAVTQLIQNVAQNPSALREAATSFLAENPQLVQQFAPDFAKGILAKLGL